MFVQARMGVYMRGRRGQHMGNVDARYEMQGEIGDDVSSVGQQGRAQCILVSRTALPHPEAPSPVLALREDSVLWQCVYGRAFMKGGHLHVGEEVPRVRVMARTHRGP